MKALRMRETCTQFTTTRNRYGDIVLTSLGVIGCLFRNASTLGLNANREEITINGIFWFAPTATVKQGDVILFNGVHYRLEGVTIANARLSTNNTHFIKCTASILRQIS